MSKCTMRPSIGPRVAVVGRVVAEERDAARDAPSVLGVVAERAGRPRVDLHRVEVGDAAPGERGDVLGVLLRGEDRVHRLGHEQRGPHAFDLAPLAHLAVRHRDDDLDELQRRARARRARAPARSTGSPSLPLRELGLGGLVEHDVREQRALRDAARRRARSRPRARSRRPSACRADASRHPIVRSGSRCQRVLTTRTISAKRPSGSPATRRVRREPSSAPSSRSRPGRASGSCATAAPRSCGRPRR